MKRRDFLKSTLPAAALLQTGLQGSLSDAQEPERNAHSHQPYDLVVIGGTLAGCFAARHAARKGLKVLLIESRTFLGTEITATLRPWLQREGFAEFDQELQDLFLPDQELGEVAVSGDVLDPSSIFGDEIPLFMGTVKKQLMRLLLQENVDILVGTGVWGVLSDIRQESAAGVVLASKFGLHAVRCRHILDTRGPASDGSTQANRQVSYTAELYGVAASAEREVPVPRSLGLVDDRVLLHRGKCKPGQCFAEFRFVPTKKNVENEARERTEHVFSHLIRNEAAFAKASIQQMAWETNQVPNAEFLHREHPYSNYIYLPPTASFDLSCHDVLLAHRTAGDQVAEISLVPESDLEPTLIDCETGTIPLDECQLAVVEDSGLRCAIQQLTVPLQRYLPEPIAADVVIAGGGTAGAMAAMGAVREGAKTVTVEFLPELGGTSTVGRVTGYYGAYKETNFYEQIEQGVKEQSRLTGRCARSVARMLHYRKQVTQAGGTLLTQCIICGVIKDGRRITGVVVENGGRLGIITGEVVIDATGDGDVAAFAGAEFDIGNQGMQCTQNYSQWDVNSGRTSWENSTSNRDHDILWSHKPAEWQRGYQLSHQQACYYDFAPFLTVRESRRIRGDCTITLKDVILARCHPDTICLAKSDFDPHHFGDTVFTRVGCLLPHQVTAVVEIPYRALLPRGIDNLLVSAKAISQTHNALQFTRMSFDIMTLGFVTGRIAARVVQQELALREFDVSTLHDELRDLKILPDTYTADAASEPSDAKSFAASLKCLLADTENSLLKMMMQTREVAEPSLREAYNRADDASQRLQLAKALAWFGNPVGNQLIAAEMQRLLKDEQAAGVLPREYYREDKGTPYWGINQDITLLALGGDPSVLPDILALADALELANPPVTQRTRYNQGRIDLRLIPFYNRIVSICFAVQRMPAPQAIGTLNRFLDDPFIRGQVAKLPREAGDKIYGGILESRLAATSARCGDKRGFLVLTEYLNDVHPMLAQYARQQLQTMLEVDHGLDDRSWKQYLARLEFPLSPTPCKRDFVEL